MRNPARVSVGLSMVLMTMACASITGVKTHHLVMFDKFGRAMDPTGICKNPRAPYPSPEREFKLCNTDFVTAQPARELLQDFDPYMKALFADLETSAPGNTVIAGNPHVTRKVLIFIHGGLNTDKDTLARVRDKTDEITAAGYYPIFVGWKSSLISSWADSLLHVRYGRWYGKQGLWLAPFYLLSDALRSIGRAPIVWTGQLANAKDNFTAVFKPWQVKENQEYCALRSDYEGRGQHSLVISKGQETYKIFPDGTISAAKFGATAGIKFVLSPFLDGIGSAAWSMMERRAHLLFYDDPDQSVDNAATALPEGNAGLAIFIRALRERIIATQCKPDAKPEDNCVNWEITLIAHSAGAIVANDILSLFPDVEFSNIVYMAAACSVSEYERAVWPYLSSHRTTRFYHLILHDVAELKEAHLQEIPPRGSLLVWIDDLFSRPVVPRDRTAGRFNNLLDALKNTPEPIRDRVSVKVFGIGRKKECPGDMRCPQQHDKFTNQRFWLEELWTPERPESDRVDGALCKQVKTFLAKSKSE